MTSLLAKSGPWERWEVGGFAHRLKTAWSYLGLGVKSPWTELGGLSGLAEPVQLLWPWPDQYSSSSFLSSDFAL